MEAVVEVGEKVQEAQVACAWQDGSRLPAQCRFCCHNHVQPYRQRLYICPQMGGMGQNCTGVVAALPHLY